MTTTNPGGSMNPALDSRARFEAKFSAPPYEWKLQRFDSDGAFPWAGQYVSQPVQFAWEAWQAAIASMPQPQPAQPLTGVKTRYMTLMGTGARIPFAVLNEEWAQNNHGQSLARLQERGGLCPTEALAIIERRRWRAMDADEALHEVLRRVDRITAPSKPEAAP